MSESPTDFPNHIESPPSFENPLHVAVKAHDNNKLDELILDVQTNAPKTTRQFINHEENAYTPLFLASETGNLHAIMQLVNNGAEYNKRSSPQQAAPLYVAAQNGHLDVVKALLVCQAIETDCRTRMNATPLFTAAQHGHLQIVKALCESGCSLNIALHNGMTPYIASCLVGGSPVAQYLVRQGVDIGKQASDKSGIEWAKQCSNWDCIVAIFTETANLNLVRRYYTILKGRAERRLALKYGAAPWLFNKILQPHLYKIVATTVCSLCMPDYEPVFANMSFSSGKHTCQLRTSNAQSFAVGVVTGAYNTNSMSFLHSAEAYVFLAGTQQTTHNCAYKQFGVNMQAGDLLEMVLDLDKDDGVLQFYVNGVDMGIAFSGLSSQIPLTPAMALFWPNESLTVVKSNSEYL